MERGGRIVVIVPEYSPPATKADYWIPIRPASDACLFLGVIKILFDENLYDADFCKQYTDSPILIRTDTLQYLDPRDVIKDRSEEHTSELQSLAYLVCRLLLEKKKKTKLKTSISKQ